MTQEEFFKRYFYNPSRDRIGGGGFGTVYKAYDNVLHREVAIKVSEVKTSADGKKTFSLKDEFEALNHVPKHPNIANYEEFYSYEDHRGVCDYAIMQYYPDGNLGNAIKQGLTAEQKEDIATQLLEGVDFLHKHKVVHRDLKPGNILIVKHGGRIIPLITDFGLSKAAGVVDGSVFSNSFGAGTPRYSSPEQLQGQPLRFNTDLWSYGAILYELFTGEQLFTAGSGAANTAQADMEIYNKIVNGNVQSLGKMPEKWRCVTERCLVVDAGMRAKDAGELFGIIKIEIDIDDGENEITSPISDDNTIPDNSNLPSSVQKNVGNNIEPQTGKEMMAGVKAFIANLFSSPKKQNDADKRNKQPTTKEQSPEIDFDNSETLLFARKRNNKTGYVNQKGKFVIPPVFDIGYSFVEGIAAVVVSDKIGFIDYTGSYIIEPRFEYNDHYFYYGFSEGLAPIMMNDKWGYINKMGNWLISPKFDDAWIFEKGLASVCVENKWGYIDTNGNSVCTPKYQYVGGFYEGLAVVSNEDFKYGYINTKGKLVMDLRFEYAGNFSDGLAVIELNGKRGFIDKRGNIVIECKYENAEGFSEGLAVVENKHLMRGYVDKAGEYVIRPQFYWAKDFKEGLAAVEIDDKWGFVDKKGNLVIKAQFDDIDESFAEGLAAVKVGGKWGFINKRGEFVVKPKFDRAYSFYHGTASVEIGEKWGLLFKNGMIIMDE